MCAVPNMAVFCSSRTAWFPGMLPIIIIIIIIIIIMLKACRVFENKVYQHGVVFMLCFYPVHDFE